jgi:PadR family transcriptional regulator PadR
MKGTHLGEFEELVLLMVGTLFDEAYGVAIKDEINDRVRRSVSLSTVHSALNRLEKKGYLTSRMGAPTQVRGGKRKRLFTLTSAGVSVLRYSVELRNELWRSIPEIAFNP